MNDWVVSKSVRQLRCGDRFRFTPQLGGEGEVLTVVSISEFYGTYSIETEELDFDLNLLGGWWVQLANG